MEVQMTKLYVEIDGLPSHPTEDRDSPSRPKSQRGIGVANICCFRWHISWAPSDQINQHGWQDVDGKTGDLNKKSIFRDYTGNDLFSGHRFARNFGKKTLGKTTNLRMQYRKNKVGKETICITLLALSMLWKTKLLPHKITAAEIGPETRT